MVLNIEAAGLKILCFRSRNDTKIVYFGSILDKNKGLDRKFTRLTPIVILLIISYLISFFNCCLGGGKAGDRYAEWRARSVVHADLSAELN